METIALVYPEGEFPKVDEIIGFFRERGYEYDADIHTPSMSKENIGFYLDIMIRVDTVYIKSIGTAEIPDEVFSFIRDFGKPCEAKPKGAVGIHLVTVDTKGDLKNPQILGYAEFMDALGGDL